ncbi:MAG: hypothetical protein FRX48_00685 [Lasallia pustulata]|uniref:Uncharacterized protein n=1 Tax=Lasallia pustulata TaxID=136370 RepID=A0A5M8Q1C8_9LECA|nr:MAG: hypothetical protein FRX48_00685 [Lasallia pustulata]
MHGLSLSCTTLAALIYLAAPSLAFPLAASSLTPRSRTCDNAPATVAGSLLPARHSTNTILWCATRTRTYIILEIITSTNSTPLRSLFTSVLYYLGMRIADFGDAVLPEGQFHWADDSGMEISTWNANNHQTTFGVVGAAVGALADYMRRTGRWGTARFWIFDGGFEVGAGELF